jgi:hypothetical protein
MWAERCMSWSKKPSIKLMTMEFWAREAESFWAACKNTLFYITNVLTQQWRRWGHSKASYPIREVTQTTETALFNIKIYSCDGEIPRKALVKAEQEQFNLSRLASRLQSQIFTGFLYPYRRSSNIPDTTYKSTWIYHGLWLNRKAHLTEYPAPKKMW